MIIYKDRLTGEELFTDAYKVCEDEDSQCLKFVTKYTSRKEGGIDDRLIGGNASAEEVQEQADDDKVTYGLEFVLNGRLGEAPELSKKDFQKYLKDYFARLTAKLKEEKQWSEDEVKIFQVRAKKHATFLLSNIKDWAMYHGENDMAMEGALCYAKYSDDGKEAEVYVFKESVLEEKC